MSLSLAEFHIRKRLPRRSTILLFDAACLLGWTTVKAIADLAGVSHARAKLELAELVRDGWLRREQQGSQSAKRKVRFSARVTGIAGDPSTGIVRDPSTGIVHDPGPGAAPTRRTHARDHAQQKETLSLDPGSMDQRVRPSRGVQGGTDGRTEGSKEPRAELRNALLAWVATRHNVEPRLSTPGLMRLVNAGATEHELRAFLTDGERGSHPCFDGLDHADFRFGAMCTVERFAKWRASRARPPRRGPSVREQLERELKPTLPALDEMTAIAELVKARMK